MRGEPVAFYFNNRMFKGGKVVATYHELGGVLRIEANNAEYLVRATEAEHMLDYEARLAQEREEREEAKAAERVEQARAMYASIIQAWDAGNHTPESIAQYLKVNVTGGLHARIKAAHRRGFLK